MGWSIKSGASDCKTFKSTSESIWDTITPAPSLRKISRLHFTNRYPFFGFCYRKRQWPQFQFRPQRKLRYCFPFAYRQLAFFQLAAVRCESYSLLTDLWRLKKKAMENAERLYFILTSFYFDSHRLTARRNHNNRIRSDLCYSVLTYVSAFNNLGCSWHPIAKQSDSLSP